jgi:hypothetical protein
MRTKHTKPEEVVIPELEAMVGAHSGPNFWSPEDIAVLRKYHRQIPVGELAKYLNRTVDSVERKAYRLRQQDINNE